MKKNILNKCMDVVEVAGKTALSIIPVGGALATAIYDTVKGNVLQKRQEKWKSMIEERLSKLETSLEELGENETFATMLIKTTELAMKTNKEEKLEYLAGALANSVSHSVDEDKLIMFMSFVEKYTTSHIKILNFFYNPCKFEVVDVSSYYLGSPTTPLEQVYPEVRPLRDKCVTDLFNDGLMNTQSLNTSMSAQGMVAKRTTSLGDEFLQFLKLV